MLYHVLHFFQIFERILFIWAIRHPASGYVQGINDLVTPFFVVFICEHVGKSTAWPLPRGREPQTPGLSGGDPPH